MLPDHTASIQDDAGDDAAAGGPVEEPLRRLSLGREATSRVKSRFTASRPNRRRCSSSSLSPKQLSEAEATVIFWNENFFLPRGVQIRLITSELPASAGPSTLPGLSQDQASRDGYLTNGTAPRKEWGFGPVGIHANGFRIGPMHADNEGFRLGRGLVANSDGFRLGEMLVANREGFQLGGSRGFLAHNQGVSLGGLAIGGPRGIGPRGIGQGEFDPRGFPARRGKSPDRLERNCGDRHNHHRGRPHSHHTYQTHRGRSHSHHGRNRHRGRSSSSSSSSSSDSSSSSSSSDSSEHAESGSKDISGLKKELKELKRARRHAKKQAKRERKAAKKEAKRARKREKRERKRNRKAGNKRHGVSDARGPYPAGPSQHTPPSGPLPQAEGIVTGVVRGASPTFTKPPNLRSASTPGTPGGPSITSPEAEELREQARALEHEARVKETMARTIRTAARGAKIAEKERLKKYDEASAIYEEAEALLREMERLRAEAEHLDREHARDVQEYGQEHSLG